MEPSVPSNSPSSCFSLPSAAIKNMWHHIRHEFVSILTTPLPPAPLVFSEEIAGSVLIIPGHWGELCPGCPDLVTLVWK